MRCRKAELWISTRVDGEEVPELEAKALERHLASCQACSRLLVEEEARARILGASLGGGDARPLVREILAIASRPPRAAPRRGVPPARALTLAAAAAVLLMGLGGAKFLAWRFGSGSGEVVPAEGLRITYEREDVLELPASDFPPRQVYEKRRIILPWRGSKPEFREEPTRLYQRLVLDSPYY
jgi:hypothetical protein